MTLNEFMQQADASCDSEDIFNIIAKIAVNATQVNLNTVTSLINNEWVTPEEYVEDNVDFIMDAFKYLAVWVSRAGYDLEDLALEVLGQ